METMLKARCGVYKQGSYRGFTEEGLAKHEKECPECIRIENDSQQVIANETHSQLDGPREGV
jgi:hypothetical protein